MLESLLPNTQVLKKRQVLQQIFTIYPPIAAHPHLTNCIAPYSKLQSQQCTRCSIFSPHTILSENKFMRSVNLCKNCWASENGFRESKITQHFEYESVINLKHSLIDKFHLSFLYAA